MAVYEVVYSETISKRYYIEAADERDAMDCLENHFNHNDYPTSAEMDFVVSDIDCYGKVGFTVKPDLVSEDAQG